MIKLGNIARILNILKNISDALNVLQSYEIVTVYVEFVQKGRRQSKRRLMQYVLNNRDKRNQLLYLDKMTNFAKDKIHDNICHFPKIISKKNPDQRYSPRHTSPWTYPPISDTPSQKWSSYWSSCFSAPKMPRWRGRSLSAIDSSILLLKEIFSLQGKSSNNIKINKWEIPFYDFPTQTTSTTPTTLKQMMTARKVVLLSPRNRTQKAIFVFVHESASLLCLSCITKSVHVSMSRTSP